MFDFDTVQTDALVNRRGFPLCAKISYLHSSLQILTIRYTESWQLLTVRWIYSYPIPCCSLFLLLSVLQMIFKCTSLVIFTLAALAVSRLTNLWLCCCCVEVNDSLDEVPNAMLDWDTLWPCLGICIAMICCCRIGEKDDNQKQWEVLSNILLASSQNGISNCQLVCSTQVEFCRIWLQVQEVSHHPTICSKSVQYWLFV